MQTVSEVMNPSVWTIQSTDSVRQAAQLMAERDIGFLPVTHEGVSAGVVTDRDIVVRAIALHLDPDATSVGAILSTEHHPREGDGEGITAGVASLLEDTSVEAAIEFMEERGIRRAAVHDRDYRMIGVVSLSDLCNACAVR